MNIEGLTWYTLRDSEESAPAEYPPEQPEADQLEDDSGAYGAEEVELENALLKELEDAEHQGDGEDHEMEGAEPAAAVPDDDASDAGSEDLEAESSGSEEEDLDEEDAGEGDDDVEMADDTNAGAAQPPQAGAEVMVH
jgi:histone chaperone ASF1